MRYASTFCTEFVRVAWLEKKIEGKRLETEFLWKCGLIRSLTFNQWARDSAQTIIAASFVNDQVITQESWGYIQTYV
jgi:hypothetical protein